MKYGIARISIIPCRAEPSEKSEMVTQALFGDHYKILEERSRWSLIRLAHDIFECWVDKKMTCEIDEKTYQSLDLNPPTCCHELIGVLGKEDDSMQPIVLGSTLPFFRNGICKTGKEKYSYDGAVVKPTKKPDKRQLVENAYMFLNAPYIWGGRSPLGVDCSGLVQVVYKMSGYKLPHSAAQQANLGQTLSFVEEAEPGDLAYFDNKDGDITHVGMILEGNYIIHASGRVRIDRIDHQGIYNPEIRDYSHKLRLIKKLI